MVGFGQREAAPNWKNPLRQHIGQARAENRRPFMFVGVPHILYRGTLLLDGIDVVEF